MITVNFEFKSSGWAYLLWIRSSGVNGSSTAGIGPHSSDNARVGRCPVLASGLSIWGLTRG